jgi:arylsulfatase A-like enzyme
MKFRNLWASLVAWASLVMAARCLIYLLEKVDGWLFFTPPWAVLASAAEHFLLAMAFGVGVGCVLSLLCVPLFLPALRRRFPAAARSIAAIVRGVAMVAITLLLVRLVLKWNDVVHAVEISRTVGLLIQALACASAIALLACPSAARARADAAPGPSQASRRTLLALGTASLGIIAWDTARGRSRFAVGPPAAAPRGAPNIILVTFDSLAAADMSLYGYDLATTPNLQAFAKSATVFRNYYSCSTFTTPSVASMLSGRYPLETSVYHLLGRLRGDDRRRTIFTALREAEYTIAASVGNPYAHPVRLGVDEPSLLTGPPPFRWTPISNAIAAAGPQTLFEFAESQEGHLWDLHALFRPEDSQYPPRLSFEQARSILAKAPRGRPYFLWVHAMAPHWPYKPGQPFRGSLPSARGENGADLARTLYDEFVAQCDGAFGDFLTALNADSRLHNTAVLVSADHGESFEGGVYGHGMPQQVRQVIHIPLIVRLPGQSGGGSTDIVADQTSLAPTILDIAGLRTPPWMKGPSLLPFVKGRPAAGGRAFTQYLSRNSIFRPPNQGTVGMIDANHQYVIDLRSGAGVLHSVAEATQPEIDHSRANPRLAATMRQAIYQRFPTLPRDHA